MIFRQSFLEGIRDGTITVAFRRWRRPSVRAGGTLLTAIGQLAIEEVTPIRRDRITADDARRAGYARLDDLLEELDAAAEGTLYRIALGAVSPDPRIALRESVPSDPQALAELRRRLEKFDAAADAPWTARTLELIASHPGVRAADLSRRMNQETPRFKLNVRKLKALGLTESLEIGYRLSLRGQAVLQAIRDGTAQ